MSFTRQTSPHGSLVVLSTMKDEGPFVVEWVAHHLALGFTELMVYTNDCSDGTDTLLKRLEAMDTGVHHRDNVIPKGIKPHPSMLKHAAEEPLIVNSNWVLVIDADEFMVIN
ncbi:MAG: glycosyltransferase family 2 protein, partial [Acetobacteraceae bacterium]